MNVVGFVFDGWWKDCVGVVLCLWLWFEGLVVFVDVFELGGDLWFFVVLFVVEG